MNEYVKVISTAAALKMNVSDYLISKLYGTIQANDELSQSIVIEVNRLKAEVNDLRATKAEAVKTAFAWKKYAETKDQGQDDATSEINELTRSTENLKNALTKSDQMVIHWKKEAEKFQKELMQSRQFANTVALKLTNMEAERLDAQKRQYSLRSALADIHDNSLMSKMPEKYWDIIDQFIPPK